MLTSVQNQGSSSYQVLPYDDARLAIIHHYHKPTRSEVSGSDRLVVSKITAVGAIIDEQGLSSRDQFWISSAAVLMRDLHIHIDHQFSFFPINMSQNGSFFDRAASTPTDLLVCCYILNPDSPLGTYRLQMNRGYSAGHICQGHTEIGWGRAAHLTGAKVVIAFSSDEGEVNGRHFENGGAYQILQTTGLYSTMDRQRYRAEVVIHKDYVPLFLPHCG